MRWASRNIEQVFPKYVSFMLKYSMTDNMCNTHNSKGGKVYALGREICKVKSHFYCFTP